MNKKILSILTAILMFPVMGFSADATTPTPTPKPLDLMEQQLASNYQDLTNWIKTTATATQGFVAEQTPLVIKEYLNWYFWSNTIHSVSFLLGILLSAFIFRFFYKKMKEQESNENSYSYERTDWSCAFVFYSIFGGFLTILMFFFMMENISNCVKVNVAPRIVLIEKMKELVK